MKKRILSLLLAICMVLSLVPTIVFAEGDSHTVTVNAGKGGKVSTDGISWTNSVSVTLDDGETLDGKVQYKADEGYAFDSVVPKIVSVAAGYQHTVLLDANGNVWTSGANDFGQLGRETSSDRDSTSFTQVTVGDGVKIKAIAADGSHTVLLDENGNVWTAGSNYYGQLGKDENKETNNANPTFTQVTVGDGVKIKAIAAGGHYTVLLDEEGNVWTAGRNNCGQLGIQTGSNINSTFIQVTLDIVITAIAAGSYHTVLLDEEGNVWTSGNNSNGQLGRETSFEDDARIFMPVTNGISRVKITAIAAGSDHTVLLDEDGNVWTAGNNSNGQLGITANSNPNPTFTQVTDGIVITAIAAGNEHTVLLDENNNVWTAGQNIFGQLGRETSSVNDSTFAKVTNGIGGVKITAIAANFIQTVLLDKDGNVWTAGSNYYGQLGRDENVGTDNANPIFKQAPVAITFDELLNTPIYTDSVFLVKFKDANLVTVNAGKGGKVSTDGISWTNSVSVKVDDGETLDGKVQYKADEGYEFDCVAPKIVSVATGDSHTVLLDANGNVWTAGWNKFGQLGRDENKETYNANPTFEQVTVGNGVKIKAIAAGGSHTVLLDENGNVWTAGSNYYGQLGKDENKETNNANPTFTQVTIDDGVKIKAIAAGGYYTVLLDEEGNVWTAGRNDYGQLGIQTGSNINSTFIQVTFDIVITAIAAGGYHTVLLDEEGNVWTAGLNNFGQLGRETGSYTNSTFIQVTFDIVITAIAAGGYHTVLLDDGGNVWTTGNNNHGQLGRETSYDIDARIFMQVTNGISGVKITAIAAGSDHTVLLDENNNVWTAGLNSFGQLGRETSSVDDSTFAKVTGGIGGVKITAIAARFVHTVLLDKDGNVWTAGRNYCGQLGRDENVGTDNANPTFAQPTVNPDAITFEELLNTPIYTDSVFLVKFKDVQKPVIKGLEKNKTYCDAVEFTVSDNGGIASVTANDVELTATNGKYTIAKGAGTVTVVATDNSGNTADVTVTVNNGHTGGEATCTEKAECDYCYEEYGGLDSTNHTGSMVWERNETQHKQYWNCCDVVVVDTEDHTWVDGVCSECDYICTHKDADKDHECDICGETLSDHTYEWQSENGQYWQKCSYCGDETEKKDIPAITISGADVVCKTQDYRFIITVPEGVTNVTWGYDFERMGNSGIEPTIEDGEMVGIMSSDYYASGETGFRVVAMAETADGFVFAERKSVVINSEHTDNNKDHICDICEETISDHTYEWQSENGQYWQKCSYCGDETEKKDIPAITISGADVVCKTQDYRFIITVPEGVTNVTWGYDFERMGTSNIEPTIEDGEMVGILQSDYYASSETGVGITVMAETADGFVFAERKSVVINSEHTDNNKDHLCDICGETLSDHTYEWQSENGQYWQKCSYCGDETEKKDIPAITIDAPNTVCKTQNCEANATIPDDITEAVLSVEFARFGGAVDITVENGMLSHIVEASTYPDDENSFNVVVYATTADGFPFEASKTVQIQDKHAGGKADCVNKAVCDTCGEEYGEADSTNHNLENIPAKAATVTETGNIEYWHCKACGKYFADENCENEIMLSDTIIAKLPPEIIDGAGQSVTEGERKELSFTSNAAYSDFVRIEIDGITLDSENYTVAEGSTVVTLNADYVAKLSVGKHTIGVVSENGTAETTFTVNAKTVDNPDTGDNSHMVLWIALAFVSGSAMLGATVAGKKKKSSAR